MIKQKNASLRNRKTEALAEVCSVHVDKTRYGVPISHILEIVGSARPQPVPLAPAYIGGLVHYRGDVLTTVSLRQLLGLPPKDGAQDILVLESAGGCFGLLVDSVGEVLTVSTADFEANPSTLEERRRSLLAGAYKLKSGLLVMLDPDRLDPLHLGAEAVPHRRLRAVRRRLRSAGKYDWEIPRELAAQEENMRALIVDDSRFVRDFLRGLLQRRGIECEEAIDGRAGLERLRRGAEFDLALVDWNMPAMNGLEMLRAMRAEGYTSVKVMMVTTEAENEFILRALNAGADEYLMKPFVDEALGEKLVMLGLTEA